MNSVGRKGEQGTWWRRSREEAVHYLESGVGIGHGDMTHGLLTAIEPHMLKLCLFLRVMTMDIEAVADRYQTSPLALGPLWLVFVLIEW